MVGETDTSKLLHSYREEIDVLAKIWSNGFGSFSKRTLGRVTTGKRQWPQVLYLVVYNVYRFMLAKTQKNVVCKRMY